MAPPIFELQKAYRDTWVVLDRAYQVIDSGKNIERLRREHGADARRIFCFIAGPGNIGKEPLAAPWSLRSLLGYAPGA